MSSYQPPGATLNLTNHLGKEVNQVPGSVTCCGRPPSPCTALTIRLKQLACESSTVLRPATSVSRRLKAFGWGGNAAAGGGRRVVLRLAVSPHLQRCQRRRVVIRAVPFVNRASDGCWAGPVALRERPTSADSFLLEYLQQTFGRRRCWRPQRRGTFKLWLCFAS
jgi:hypothetical protein